jgi:putative DNA methylase
MTVYYAFKQAETTVDGVASTGWETMLQSVLDAGFSIDGTWPMRSELANRMIASGTNALATSIVLVCRHRPAGAPMATRREFVDALRAELPGAVRTMQHGNIAPVDLAQASIGPGMAVFSKFSKVVEADGTPMRVRRALELINQVLDDTVAGNDADFDHDTRWATTWFEEYGMNEGVFGRAEQLTKSRNTSIRGLADAGIIAQRPERVRLKTRDELPTGWDPMSDRRLTVWEGAQHLIRRLESEGEESAAALLRQVGSGLGEAAKELAYRLYLVCERQGWAKEAVSYNGLVTAWPEVSKLAKAAPSTAVQDQATLL